MSDHVDTFKATADNFDLGAMDQKILDSFDYATNNPLSQHTSTYLTQINQLIQGAEDVGAGIASEAAECCSFNGTEWYEFWQWFSDSDECD